MLELIKTLEPHATTISAGSAFFSALAVLISTGFIIWTTCFRKTRRDKIDDLKLEVLEVVSTVKGHEDWVKAMDLSENKGRAGIVKIMDLTHLLGKNYQKQRWYKLLPVALAELRNEGYHESLGLPPTAKVSYQPHKIIVGSPTN